MNAILKGRFSLRTVVISPDSSNAVTPVYIQLASHNIMALQCKTAKRRS